MEEGREEVVRMEADEVIVDVTERGGCDWLLMRSLISLWLMSWLNIRLLTRSLTRSGAWCSR